MMFNGEGVFSFSALEKGESINAGGKNETVTVAPLQRKKGPGSGTGQGFSECCVPLKKGTDAHRKT